MREIDVERLSKTLHMLADQFQADFGQGSGMPPVFATAARWAFGRLHEMIDEDPVGVSAAVFDLVDRVSDHAEALGWTVQPEETPNAKEE